MRWLSRREHGRLELLQKLKLRGVASEVAEAVVAELERTGLQSDRRLAEATVRKAVRRGYGVNRLNHDLSRFGAEKSAAEEFMQDVDWDRLIGEAYAKKYRGVDPLTPKELAARIRFLSQRGFTQEQIRALFKRLGLS